ncbi:MAG: type II toxin-antitoxin system VapC family toxin [Verrucomicrobia bacterium]|nr:type II toxin-antitoxin system VapC family toxin [Verrucomicrobiota bacterium]
MWLVKGEAQARPIANLPSGTILGLASISVWEVGMLETKGRLALQPDARTWVNAALQGLRLLPLDAEAALRATRLPGSVHGDPADRIIIATAQILKVPLLTADARIIQYAGQGHLQVMAL